MISEGIQGERHVLELKLTVEMPSRMDERHNLYTLYWSRGGVRPLSIVDSADVRTCLVSSKYGRKRIEGALTLGMHLCGSAYCIYLAGEEPRIGLAIPTKVYPTSTASGIKACP